jgi:predicted aldo/keto reductase-like oxidoreductase
LQASLREIRAMSDSSFNRREWLAATALGLSQVARAATGDMPYRPLGKTGEKVSLIGMGGYHLGKPKLTDDEAVRLVREGLDHGINFLDNSWDYNNGQSEIRVGKALQNGYRQKAFVMTKVDGRTKAAAAQQIDQSLTRLKTDHIDLLQHHEVIRFEDPDRIFAPGGSMEAFLEAKKAGKIRFIGFTGHKDPHIHLYMLEVADRHGFHFDTVQMPLNVMDAHYRSFGQLVVPEAQKREIGILGMKSMGGPVILKSHTVTPVECLHFAMNLPVSVVITGIDSQQVLDQALKAARDFRPMNEQQVSAITSKTKAAAEHGKFELFKTTAHFDSTAQHPEWLGGETEMTKELAQGT